MTLDTMHLRILPGRAGQTAGFVNLNDHARALRPREVSPFLQPAFTDRYLRLLHRRLGIDYSLGGYLEDRAALWRGSYLGHDNACHLGIDVNVPADTKVTVAYDSVVEHILHDHDQEGGWGSVVALSLAKPLGSISHFLYAHLGENKIDATEGQAVNPGTIIGRLGRSSENGGWYEHLHVQAMTSAAWRKFNGNLSSFDGYGALPADGKAHPLFPDPRILL